MSTDESKRGKSPFLRPVVLFRKQREEFLREKWEDLPAQHQNESVLRSREERKERLREKVERMEKCKEDLKEYLKIKDMKTQQAVKKARRDKQLIHQKQQRLNDLREEASELLKLKERLEKRTRAYELYHHYMNRVVLASKRDAVDLISRCSTAMRTREDLQLSSQQNIERTREAREELAVITKQSSDAVMQLHSRVAQLQRSLDEANQTRLYWVRRLTMDTTVHKSYPPFIQQPSKSPLVPEVAQKY